jgi:GxxExxY protein
MEHENITGGIISSAMQVHSALGPGLLESAYEACLCYELRQRGHNVASQVPLPVIYGGVHIDAGYRLDIVVDDTVIVELKAIEKLLPIHHAQLLSYLKLSGLGVGLIINFHELHLCDGIRRLMN